MSAYAVVGPDRHGVVTHALRLAGADPRLADSLVRVAVGDHATVARDLTKALDGHRTAMLHVTDHLFGETPAAAADLIEALARTTSLVLCLHDLPQPAEGEERHARRCAAYARLARCARVVVVASEHEHQLLLRCLDPAEGNPRGHADDDGDGDRDRDGGGAGADVDVVVLPLPVERIDTSTVSPDDAATEASASLAPGRRRSPDRVPVIGVLGFLYPGKGLDDVIAAAAEVAATHPVSVVNIGAVAAGHDDLAVQLTALASDRGVDFRVSGFVPEGELFDVLREVDVPVAAHRHVSASGSVNSWIAAGRRPLVLEGSYTRELDARMPGAVTLVETPAALVAAIETALREPSSTWIADGVTIGPSWSESAAAHADVLRGVA